MVVATRGRPKQVPEPAREEEIQETPDTPEWVLCPKCLGKGVVPSDRIISNRGMKGVRIIRHERCPICMGLLMVPLHALKGKADGGKPIIKCGQCRNWYAQGGGRPEDEPCYQEHAHIGKAHSCCHWHDLSVHAPLSQEQYEAYREAFNANVAQRALVRS